MTVKLKERRQGNSKKISILAVTYKGQYKTPDGKVKLIRSEKSLGMYLYHKPKTSVEREHNKVTRQRAEKVRFLMESDLQDSHYGFTKNNTYKDTNFLDYYSNISEAKRDSPSYGVWQSSLSVFRSFAGADITFGEITERFCERFLSFLCSKNSHRGCKLSSSTIRHHFYRFSYVVNRALSDRIITENPLLKIKRLKVRDTEPIYLTLNELQSLVNTTCSNLELKCAFIFSCLTGCVGLIFIN